MKVDSGFASTTLASAEATARQAERLGYDGMWTGEAAHDPFLPLAVAAQHSERIELGTSIAVAFPRSPMHLAMTANDLQAWSRGRFILGLGSQVKAHVEKRFSATWSRPADRMRELVLAMRAIWAAWNGEAKLDFRGEFYTHTLMTPFFDPGPNPFGPPKVFLAAVGQRMTEVAGEVAHGMLAHAFTTAPYLRDATVPALERGLARSGRTRADVEVSCPVLVATGTNDEEWERARVAVRRQLAFYGSTPAYRPVLEHHGWGDLQTELHALSKQGRWEDMGRVVDDDVLEAFAVVGRPDELSRLVTRRFEGLLDRLSFYAPYKVDSELWGPVATAIQAATRAAAG